MERVTLRELRKKFNLSQRHLAAAARCSQVHIVKLEMGDIPMSDRMAGIFAELLHTDKEALQLGHKQHREEREARSRAELTERVGAAR